MLVIAFHLRRILYIGTLHIDENTKIDHFLKHFLAALFPLLRTLCSGSYPTANWVICLLDWFLSTLYILDVNPLSDV